MKNKKIEKYLIYMYPREKLSFNFISTEYVKMSTNYSEDMNGHSKYFVDTDNFSFSDNKVFLKNDRTTWAKVVLNGLNIDDYLLHQNFVPQIKPDLGGRSISEFSFFNTKNIAERYPEKISNKNIAKMVSEVESSKTFSWDCNKRCVYCCGIVKTDCLMCTYTYPRENHSYHSSFDEDEEDEHYELEMYIKSLTW